MKTPSILFVIAICCCALPAQAWRFGRYQYMQPSYPAPLPQPAATRPSWAPYGFNVMTQPTPVQSQAPYGYAPGYLGNAYQPFTGQYVTPSTWQQNPYFIGPSVDPGYGQIGHLHPATPFPPIYNVLPNGAGGYTVTEFGGF